jgi:hypothetical protein
LRIVQDVRDRILHVAPAKPEAFPPDDATLSPLSFY